MIYRNLMVLPKNCASQIALYNCAISFKNGNTFHLVNKNIFRSDQWMHYYTAHWGNSKYSDTIENDYDHNLLLCSDTKNVDYKFNIISLQNSLQKSKCIYKDLYLKCPKVARVFVDLIKDDLLKNMSNIFELNPGFGFVTEELLQIGVPFINLLESNTEFLEQLNDLNTRFPNQLSLKKLNMLTWHSENNSKINTLLNQMQQKKWEEESCMQIIGATMNKMFIKHLILSTVFQTGLMIYGRPIFYLALPPSLSNKCYINKRSSPCYVMFNILFNYKIFGTVNRKAFLPRSRSMNKRKTDSFHLNVIKIEPKPELFTLFKTKKDLIFFWHFVRHYYFKPSSRVIPSLEQIIPDCGIKLIAKNYNIFTTFSELTPNQVYELFLEFQSWPKYQNSTFILSANDIKNIYQLYMEED